MNLSQTKNQLSDKNQNEVDDFVSDFIEHHGVKDQTWGVTHGPPYPLNRNAAKQAKLKAKAAARAKREKEKTKKRIAKEEEKAKKREVIRENKHIKEVAKAEKAAEDKMVKEAKQKKKYSKTAESLYKHREMYTTQEIAEALQKFEWENRIKDYMDKDLTRAKNKASTMADTTKSIMAFASSAIDGYNMAVGVGNSLLDLDLKPIRIPQSKKEDKKND